MSEHAKKEVKPHEGENHFPEDAHAPKQTQTEFMEVHKHPHHVMHKKKWTEYLLEFFMIFFAVTAGFFAENFRETLSEHSKEKEYAHSLLVDLRSDTLVLNRTVASNERYAADDSVLLSLLEQPSKDKATIESIYALYPQTQKFIVEIADTKTFEQLKNNGDLRLLRKKAVLDSMSVYYQRVSRMMIYRDEIQAQLQTTYNLSNKLFDYYSYRHNSGSPVSLITADPALTKEYVNKLYLLTENIRKYDIYLQRLSVSTINFIKTVEDGYRFDEE